MADLAIADHHELTAGDEEQLVTMMVDGQLFGIPILKVQDIVEPTQITPVPLAPSAIAGVLNLRGRIVTVIDLRVCLGANQPNSQEKQMSVTVEHRGDLYTLLVDSIGDVRSLPRRDFDRPPTTLDENTRRLCSGIFRLEKDLLVVLDVQRILDEETINKTMGRTTHRKRWRKPSDRDRHDDAAMAAGSGETDPKKAEPSGQALYARLGGELGIDALVDLYFEKVEEDNRVSALFRQAEPAKRRAHMRGYLTEVTGGEVTRDTADASAAHVALLRQAGFRPTHFDALGAHMRDVMIRMGMPDALIEEFMGFFEQQRAIAQKS